MGEGPQCICPECEAPALHYIWTQTRQYAACYNGHRWPVIPDKEWDECGSYGFGAHKAAPADE